MRLIPEGPDIPEALLNDHADGKVVLFCGAGISLDAGYPLFGGLVDKLKKKNPVSQTPELQEAIDQGDLDFALSIIQKKLAKNSGKLRRDTAKILSKRPSTLKNHTTALRLSSMRDGTCRLITTNFDRLFVKAGQNLGLKKIDSAPRLPIPKADRWNSILHLHGLIPKQYDSLDLGNLVLTSADFGEAYVTESYCSRFVVELLRNFTVVFIGYSLNDRIMRYLLDAISYSEKFFNDNQSDSQFKKPYAFVEHNEDNKSDVIRKWELKEVTPIPYFVEASKRTKRGSHYRLYNTLGRWADLASGGQNARVTLALNEATKPYLPEDTFGQQRLLWALRDENGKAAEALANVENKNQTASIDWLPFFAQNGLLDQTYSPLECKELSAKAQGNSKPPLENRYLGSVTYGNGDTRLKPVSSHLVRWMQWHLGETKLVDWFLKNGAVPHPDFSAEYSRRKKTPEQKSLTAEHRKLWDLLTSDMYLQSQIPTSHWYDLHDTLDFNDPFDASEFLTHAAPKLEIKPSYHRELEEHDDNFLAKFEFKLKLYNQEMDYKVGQIINTPALQTGLEKHCEQLTQSVKAGLHWLSLVNKISGEDDLTQYSIPSISPHDQNENVHDFGNLVFLLRTAFDRLCEHDKQAAINIAYKWLDIDYPLFKRLFLYAANICGTPLDKLALSMLTDDGGRWLWSLGTRREVNVYLRERVKSWTETKLSTLCSIIIKGPKRSTYRDMSDPEWIKLRDHSITKFLVKLEQGGVEIPKKAADRLSKLMGNWPYIPPDDNSDEFVIFSSGFRSVGWDDEIHSDTYKDFAKFSKQQKISGWNSEQGVMFRKFAISNAKLALETLELGLSENLSEETFWHEGIKGISEGIEQDDFDPETKAALIKKMLFVFNSLPESTIQNNQVGYSIVEFWRKYIGDLIRNSHHLQIWDRTWSAAKTEKPEDEDINDPVSYAINNSAGKLTEEIFEHLWPKDAKVNGGLPSDLTSRIQRIIESTSHEHIDASAVIVASRTEILHAVDPDFTKRFVVPLFNWEFNPKAAAYWSAFLWPARVSPDLFKLLENDCIKALKEPNRFEDRTYERLCQVFLLASMEFKATSDQIVAEVLDAIKLTGLNHMSSFIRQRMLNSRESSSNYWSKTVQPWLRKYWPRDAEKQSNTTMENFAMTAIYSGTNFPEALRWMEDNGLLGELPTSSVILYSLRDRDDRTHDDFRISSTLVEKYPRDVIHLLWLTRPFRWDHRYGWEIVQATAEYDTTLFDSMEYKDLLEILKKSGN